MKTGLFINEHLKVLLKPERWRIVCSVFPSEEKEIQSERLLDWVKGSPDSHTHRELMIGLSGLGKYVMEGKVYPVKPGTVFCFDSFVSHQQAYPPFAADTDHLWVSLLRGHVAARIICMSGGRMTTYKDTSIVCTEDEVGCSLGRSAFGYSEDEDVPDDLRRTRLMATVAGVTSAIVRRGMGPFRIEDAQSSQARMIDAVKQHIHDTAGRGVGLEDLAQIAGYSKYHFFRLFKQYTGETVLSYIDHCRRAKVKAMQAEGALKKQMSAELGFSCPAAFSRWYRKHMEEGQGEG